MLTLRDARARDSEEVASLPSGRRVEERTETELARGDDRLATLELWVGNLFIHEELVGRRNF